MTLILSLSGRSASQRPGKPHKVQLNFDMAQRQQVSTSRCLRPVALPPEVLAAGCVWCCTPEMSFPSCFLSTRAVEEQVGLTPRESVSSGTELMHSHPISLGVTCGPARGLNSFHISKPTVRENTPPLKSQRMHQCLHDKLSSFSVLRAASGGSCGNHSHAVP